jgi:hypothetical protein
MPGIWSLSKKDANYRPAPKPEVSCRVCEFMGPRAPYGTCKYVRGVIQGTATCDEFQPHRRKPADGTGS